MGHRANLVVMEKGVTEVYCDEWGALSLPGYLFWGPNSALKYIRSNAKNDTWLDEIWAEGAALMDLDKKALMFFGGDGLEDDIILQRELVKLMGPMWPGWQVRWAGLAEMADYAGYQRELVLNSNPRTPVTGEGLAAALVEAVPLEAGEEDYIYFCLSFKDQDGSLRFFRSGSYMTQDQVLLYGPDLINICRTKKGAEHLDLERLPASGIHIDEGNRTIEFWNAWSSALPLEAVKKVWEGYETTLLGRNFERQLELGQGRLSFKIGNREKRLEVLRPAACLEPVDYSEGQGLVSKIFFKVIILIAKITSGSKGPKLPSLSARRKKFDQIVTEIYAGGD